MLAIYRSRQIQLSDSKLSWRVPVPKQLWDSSFERLWVHHPFLAPPPSAHLPLPSVECTWSHTCSCTLPCKWSISCSSCTSPCKWCCTCSSCTLPYEWSHSCSCTLPCCCFHSHRCTLPSKWLHFCSTCTLTCKRYYTCSSCMLPYKWSHNCSSCTLP